MDLQEWKELQRLAKEGDPRAAFEVGLLYDEGLMDSNGNILVKQDPRQAVIWYRLSAEYEDSEAQNSLGYCLDIGHGVQKNKKEALLWYKKAFKNGNPCAANNIATIYRDLGNQRRAFFWYQRATEQHDDDALLEVGWRYYHGVGVRKNYQEAIKNYLQAIESESITEAGKENAMYYLGIAYFEGKGVKISLSKAQKWLEQANKDGDHVKAQELLEKIRSVLS